jgi:acetyl-CoA C-acetyltransferase
VTGVFILSAARTPIGKYGGALRDVHPAELGAVAARSAIARAELAPGDIDEVLFGHARQAGSGPNPARQVGRRTGVPDPAPAFTVNKACASGLQAIASGAASIMLGESEIVLAGGMESMSRVPYLVDAVDARWGHRMGNFALVDAMYRDGFQCPLANLIMGETAEVLARQYGISRDESDCFAFESQRKAASAIAAGHFSREIAPVTVNGSVVERDEHPRRDTTLEGLRKLPPVFGGGRGGVITAGSSSGITDGGAALVLASAAAVRARGFRPRARILGWASAGVDPRIMGIGPVPAIRKLLDRTGLAIDDFDVVELNEAFAAQVLAVLKDVPISRDRINVNGGAIALGHPIGCTGARIVVTLLHELERRGAARGLAALCVSGGMGMALAIEALDDRSVDDRNVGGETR